MDDHDSDVERKQREKRELKERYGALMIERWQDLAVSWIGDESPEREPRSARKKRYFLDKDGWKCRLCLWYGTMEYVAHGLADLDGNGFYQEDYHKPLVVMYTSISWTPDPFFITIHDFYWTFLEPGEQQFKLATFEAYEAVFETLRAALLKPWSLADLERKRRRKR